MIRIAPAISIIVLLLHAVGCNTLGKQLNGLNESTIKITQAVIPDWDKRCLDAATACANGCKKKNTETPDVVIKNSDSPSTQPITKISGEECKKNCESYQTCKKQRDIFYTAVNAIHTSIEYAIAFMQSGEEPKAQAILAKIITAVADVYKLAQDAGFTLK